MLSAILILIFIGLSVWSYVALKGDNQKSTRETFVNWLVFGVIVSLVPFIFGTLVLIAKNKNSDFGILDLDYYVLISKGELFLIALAIGSSALGNLIVSENKKGILRIIAGGGCVVLVLSCAFAYALFLVPDDSLELKNIVNISPSIYLMSLFSSGFSIIISELK